VVARPRLLACAPQQADPCSLTCGHSFDRFCLQRALASKVQCPVCRAACAPTAPDVNVLFRDALALLFPEELAKRSVELAAARAEAAAARAEAARVRAEEERQRAAAPRPLHDGHAGTTMFALFQVHAAPPPVAGQARCPVFVPSPLCLVVPTNESVARPTAARRAAAAARRAPPHARATRSRSLAPTAGSLARPPAAARTHRLVPPARQRGFLFAW
jgi:hypothetical protein